MANFSSISISSSSFLPPSRENIDDALSNLSCALSNFDLLCSKRSKIPFFGSLLSAYTVESREKKTVKVKNILVICSNVVPKGQQQQQQN